MGKRSTRADLILKGARERVRIAQLDVDTAKEGVMELQANVDIAQAVLMAHTAALSQLEKDLAPTPRKEKGPKSTAPVAGKKSRQRSWHKEPSANTAIETDDAGSAAEPRYVPVCVICNSVEEYGDHYPESESYHIFRTSLSKKEKVVLPENPDGFISKAAGV